MAIGLAGLADVRSMSMMQAMSYQAGQAAGDNSGNQAAGATVSPAYSLELTAKSNKTGPELQRLKRTGQIECQACKERKYQDGSNDPGVSFKAPGHISPESSAAVVMSHEQEHVGKSQPRRPRSHFSECPTVYLGLSGMWQGLRFRRRNAYDHSIKTAEK